MDEHNNSDAHHTVEICEEESDGHAVYAYYEFEDGAERAAYDGGGADGRCAVDERVRTADMTHLSVCEELAWWPDRCRTRERGL